MNSFYNMDRDGVITRRDGIPIENLPWNMMCEKIIEADFLVMSDGSKPTVEQVFNSSPNGELCQVYFWYLDAVAILAKRESDKNANNTRSIE